MHVPLFEMVILWMQFVWLGFGILLGLIEEPLKKHGKIFPLNSVQNV